MKPWLFPSLMLLWLLMHLPFLAADPDTQIDLNTRGAWTDEGHYTAVARDFIDCGHFRPGENSTFVRGPLYSLLQMPFFALLGTHLWVARLLTVLFLAGIMVLFYYKVAVLRPMMLFLLLPGLFQPHLFHFSHYAMAEIICISFILLALFFLTRWKNKTDEGSKGIMQLFFAGMALFLAYSFKIQFLYAAVLLPFTMLIVAAARMIRMGKWSYKMAETLLQSLMITIFFLLVYWIWYRLNLDFYNDVMSHETAGRYPVTKEDLWAAFTFNISRYLLVKELKVMVLLLLPAVVYLLFRRLKKGGATDLPFVFACCWLVLELHKLPMMYIPNRYLLSLFAACSLLLAAALGQLWTEQKYFRSIGWCFALSLSLLYVSFLWESYTRRTFEMKEANAYLSRCKLDESYVLGSWAPSLTWESKVKAIPVWENYLNDRDPIKRFNPQAIIYEVRGTEGDIYGRQGIDLWQASDSLRVFRLWRYEVGIFWMKR